MKQKLKNGWEYDLVSDWRKKGIYTAKPGGWKYIKRRLNRRHRREGKKECRESIDK